MKKSKRKDAASSSSDPPCDRSPAKKSKVGEKASDSKSDLDQTIHAQVCKLRGEKGVGSPYQMHSTKDKKAASLSEYTLTCEAIFGPDAGMIDEDDDIEEELKKRDDLKRYTWSGPMEYDCVRSSYGQEGSDRLKFDIPEDTPKDDMSADHLRIYITSPSNVTYKLFEFDCREMTCTDTGMWCFLGSSSSSWTTKYNEDRHWKLPYRYKSPRKGLTLVVSVSVGKTYEQMIGLDWKFGKEQLVSEQVLAYLNGDEIKEEEYVDPV